jgi:hypothetical protein
MFDRYELKQQLSDNVVTIVFEKKDGTMRTMRCTLLAEYLPAPKPVEEGSQLLQESRGENENTIAVWDLDNGGWRSFRMDSIKSIAVG